MFRRRHSLLGGGVYGVPSLGFSARREQPRALWMDRRRVVLATGLWAVFTFYVDHAKPPLPPSYSVEVHNGNVIAWGPNATFNAPVNINPDAKEVVATINERLDKLAAQVAREKGVEVAPLFPFSSSSAKRAFQKRIFQSV
jgi:hypothetical protein